MGEPEKTKNGDVREWVWLIHTKNVEHCTHRIVFRSTEPDFDDRVINMAKWLRTFFNEESTSIWSGEMRL